MMKAADARDATIEGYERCISQMKLDVENMRDNLFRFHGLRRDRLRKEIEQTNCEMVGLSIVLDRIVKTPTHEMTPAMIAAAVRTIQPTLVRLQNPRRLEMATRKIEGIG